ncbi:MAG: nitrous oxide reductase accessory protein NosL, partial [Geminicoccaceae bacterium]
PGLGRLDHRSPWVRHVAAAKEITMNLLRLAPACLMLLTACDGDQVAMPPPPPAELTSDAIGHYCSMVIAEHPGPKAHIFAGNRDDPVWFPSVRDMFAYTMLPEENQDIRAIYVSDTGATDDYADVAEGAWIEARKALYVLGREIDGGMGLPEAVPFADRDQATAFTEKHGGEILAFDEVSPDFVFAEIEPDPATTGDKL